MASTVLGACRHIPTIARVSTAARQSMCASLQCASGSATSASVSSKRSLHSTSVIQKEAGPVEQKLQEQVTTLAADAARKIDPAVLKKEPSPKIDQIADMICALNMIEAMQLSESLKRKLGLPDNFNVFARGVPGGAAAPAAAAAAPAAAAAAPAAAPKAEEKATVDIKLKSFKADAKIKVIKEVRAVTNLGLKEAKELVERAPVTIMEKVKTEEAAKIAEKLKTETGAEIELV